VFLESRVKGGKWGGNFDSRKTKRGSKAIPNRRRFNARKVIREGVTAWGFMAEVEAMS